MPPHPGLGQGCAFAVVHAETVLEIAHRAVRRRKVAQRRAAGLDRLQEHIDDRRRERVGAPGRRPVLACEGRRATPGAQTRAVQRLADVDVAEPRYDRLVEQRRLQGHLPAGHHTRERGGVEQAVERLEAEVAQVPARFSLRGRYEAHEAEAPGIVEDGDTAIRQA